MWCIANIFTQPNFYNEIKISAFNMRYIYISISLNLFSTNLHLRGKYPQISPTQRALEWIKYIEPVNCQMRQIYRASQIDYFTATCH